MFYFIQNCSKICIFSVVCATFFLTLLSCQPQTNTAKLKTVEAPTHLIKDELKFFIKNEKNSSDTLITHLNEHGENVLIFRRDTLFKDFTYIPSASFLQQFTIFGDQNLFLMHFHQGDGCPSAYQLLQIFETIPKGYVLSDVFGNCETFTGVRLDNGYLIFDFPANSEAKRKKEVFRYKLGEK